MTKEQECMKALQCLYLEVPSVIADDVKQKVIDALNEVKNRTIPDVIKSLPDSDEIRMKARERIAVYENLLTNNGYYRDIMTAKCCAIQSVNHAINCLEAVIKHDKERYGITSRGASIQLDEQLELKKILEQRS
jgi:hypothetical protein